MRAYEITAAAVSLVTGIAAAAVQPVRIGGQNLIVYLDNGPLVPSVIVWPAKTIAARMFAGIGVGIRWRNGQPTPSQLACERPIVIRLAMDTRGTPAGDLQAAGPDAAAFARPYEGVHVAIFYDRVTQAAKGHTPMLQSVLLAHVMAHEIAHMIQGCARHSGSGVMKPHWSYDDYVEMMRRPLPFMAEDTDLIRGGLERRAGAGQIERFGDSSSQDRQGR
jgi:hypothetical protein